jgi:hypothetical protein
MPFLFPHSLFADPKTLPARGAIDLSLDTAPFSDSVCDFPYIGKSASTVFFAAADEGKKVRIFFRQRRLGDLQTPLTFF